MADLKPRELPAIGKTIKTGQIKTTTATGSRIAVVTEWRNDITWQGFHAYNPYARGVDAAPSPNLQFKYGNSVYRRTRPNKVWTRVSVFSWPFRAGGLPAIFWSDRSPQNLYGWTPYQPPRTENGGPGGNGDSGGSKSGGSNNGGGGTSQTGTNTNVGKRTFKGKVFTNPPLHSQSKAHTAPFERASPSSARLGLIYLPQDFVDPNKAYSKRWGFRFLYNPTFWGYSMAVDESQAAPSQTINSIGNPSPLPGTATWSVELYLNRIADMKKINQNQKYYAGKPSLTELRKLWARGTEYDLDFLYRTINGDPKSVPNFKHPTANLGFLVAQRVGVRLADGAFFYGRITNIDVQHVMMTDMLVPTFSKVVLNISEYIQPFTKKK